MAEQPNDPLDPPEDRHETDSALETLEPTTQQSSEKNAVKDLSKEDAADHDKSASVGTERKWGFLKGLVKIILLIVAIFGYVDILFEVPSLTYLTSYLETTLDFPYLLPGFFVVISAAVFFIKAKNFGARIYSFVTLIVGVWSAAPTLWQAMQRKVDLFVQQNTLYTTVIFGCAVIILIYVLYRLRCNGRIYYGILELVIGAGGIKHSYAPIIQMLTKNSVDTTNIILTFASSTYVFIRGFSNIEDGLKVRWKNTAPLDLPDLWRVLFYKNI